MRAQASPYLGFFQPGTGLERSLASDSVTTSRKSKRERGPTIIRMVLAQNVAALRDRKFKHLDAVTDRNEALAKEIGSSKEQVRRLCKGDLGTSIDTVEWLAAAFGVRPQDLLTPYFATGDQPTAPQPRPPSGEAAHRRRRDRTSMAA